MKLKNLLGLATGIILMCQSDLVKAQLYTYTNDETGVAGTVATGVTASNLTPVNGVVAINACGTGYSSDTWSTSTGAFSTAFSAIQLTLTPTTGYNVTVTAIQFDLGRNPQGPQRMRYAYSTNGGLTWTNNGSDYSIPSGACGSGTTFTWDLPDFTTASPVLIRIYGWNANNVNGQSRIYNGVVSGSTCALTTWYADADGDGYGNAAVSTVACNAPVGYVADNTDCNDANASINPGMAEICNGIDDNCNGSIDEGLTFTTYYADADGDGYGDPGTSVTSCAPVAGYVADNTDCNDASGAAYPGATEVCDGIDNDCDGDIDENVVTAVMSPTGDVTTCKSDDFVFSVEPCAGCTYQWFKNDNVIVGATSTTYATTKPAYYNVQVTTAAGCFDVSDYALLTTLLNPNANIYNPNGLNLCAPTPGTNILIKVGYTATNSYQWYKDGLPYTGDGATSWKIYPTETGDYYCAITAASGCYRETEVRTVINACRMADVAAQGVNVYPNPASNKVTVSLSLASSAEYAEITIVNMMGQSLATTTTAMSDGMADVTINTADLPAGMYTVIVRAGDQINMTELMIVK